MSGLIAPFDYLSIFHGLVYSSSELNPIRISHDLGFS
jgi:hypothetical protein